MRRSGRGCARAQMHIVVAGLALACASACRSEAGQGSDGSSSSASSSGGATDETGGATDGTGDASETGDMVLTPAECGDDNVAAGSRPALARWPYVQNVTPSSVVVAWGVAAPGGATVDSAPASELRFGRDPAYAGQAAVERVQLIPAMPDGGDMWLYSATMTGLEPATDYCYKVFTDGDELAGGFRVRTAPAGEDAVVRFVSLGDFGGGTEEQRRVLEQIMAVHEAEGVDFLLSTGDNAYGEGTHVEWQTNVFDVYRELFAEVPFFGTIGNHDDKTDEAQPYLDNLFLPQNALREQDRERYYSVDWGPLHVVGLDTERALNDMLPGQIDPELKAPDEQDGWFRQDMKASALPWKIVAFHQPVFSNTEGRTPEMRMREGFVPLFQEFGVQLVLQGHNHLYERYHPIKDLNITTTQKGGVVYVVTGGGGKSLYEEDSDQDPWQVTYAEVYHFVYGVIDGCTLTLSAIDLEGDVFDESVITRC